MSIEHKNYFVDCLDAIIGISGEMVNGKGEDNFYHSHTKHSAIVSVFDGCGGLGSRMYDSFGRHTGAYMASRALSGAVHDWYHSTYNIRWKSEKNLVQSLRQFFDQALEIVSDHGKSTLKLSGSMVRDFPTTAAIALVQDGGDHLVLHAVWAGDSRVYFMDADGLAQITQDDVDGEDALSNLSSDGALTNLVSSDREYELHYKKVILKQPCVVFAATDGCFGYVPTPMEFEYLLIDTLSKAETPADYEYALKQNIRNYAGDDYTMGMLIFGYADFASMKEAFKSRRLNLEKKYIEPLLLRRNEIITNELWRTYRKTYERYM